MKVEYDFSIGIPPEMSPYSPHRAILEAMPVDASYFFEGADIKPMLSLAQRLRPMAFTMRQRTEQRKIGVRVWRLPDGTKSLRARCGAQRKASHASA